MRMRKRAQANIITVVLIILIVIVAMIIVWNVIQPLIRRTSEDIGTTAFTTQLEIEDAKLWVTGGAQISVKRGAGKGNITSLKFVFEKDDGKTEVIERKKEDGYGMPYELETKTYDFNANEINEKIEKVSVMPMFGKVAGMEIAENEPSKSAVDSNSGLVSWWKFDGDARDSVGGNDGSLEGGAYVNEGGELVLDSVDDYVNYGNNVDFDFGSNDFTISSWIKTSKIASTIFSKGSAAGEGYIFHLDGAGRINLYTMTTAWDASTGSVILNDNNWHHVVVTKSGTTINIYNDANPDTSNIISGSDISGSNIHNALTGQVAAISWWVDGLIDNIMIFNKALTEEQINAIYNNQRK